MNYRQCSKNRQFIELILHTQSFEKGTECLIKFCQSSRAQKNRSNVYAND